MRRQSQSILAIALLCLSGTAHAQEPKTIKLFEGESELPTTEIAIEGNGGDGEGWDGSNTARVDGGITLHYERNGSSILVPATVEGKPVYFIFDTGATYTTLTSELARSTGIMPAADGPSMTMSTANGMRAAKVGLIRSLGFGGRNHSAVTFVVCDSCPAGTHQGKPIVGLLGMNVIGRYQTSFDDGRGVIQMLPSIGYGNRTRDVEPWVSIDYNRSVRVAKALKLDAIVHNRAARRISKLQLRITCSGGDAMTWSKAVDGKGRARIEQSIHSGNCDQGFDVRVVDASW